MSESEKAFKTSLHENINRVEFVHDTLLVVENGAPPVLLESRLPRTFLDHGPIEEELHISIRMGALQCWKWHINAEMARKLAAALFSAAIELERMQADGAEGVLPGP